MCLESTFVHNCPSTGIHVQYMIASRFYFTFQLCVCVHVHVHMCVHVLCIVAQLTSMVPVPTTNQLKCICNREFQFQDDLEVHQVRVVGDSWLVLYVICCVA